MPTFKGAIFDNTGVAANLVTVELFTAGTTTPVVATDTTDTSGNWDLSTATNGLYDIKVTGDSVFWILGRDKIQFAELNLRNDTADEEALIVSRTEVAPAGQSMEVAIFETDDASPADNDEGYISFRLSDDAGTQTEFARMTWVAKDVSDTTEDGALAISTMTAGSLTEKVRIDETGTMFMGVAASYVGSLIDNADMTVGLTINQGAADDAVLAFKSSDVGHAMTGAAEADSFAIFRKGEALAGGLLIDAYKDADGVAGAALSLRGSLGEAADTTDTATSRAIVEISGRVTDGGTSVAATADAGNVFLVSGTSGGGADVIFLLKGNGDAHITNTTLTALDEEDDIGLVRAFQRQQSNGMGIVISEWDSFVKANQDDLIKHKVLSSQGDFIIQQNMNALLGGAIWQLATRLFSIEQNLAALPEGK